MSDKPQLSQTMAAKVLAAYQATTSTGEKQTQTSRVLEDVGFLVGILQALLYGLAEFLIRISVVKPGPGGVPYMTIALFLGCVLPKMLGRATAGRIWTILARKWKP